MMRSKAITGAGMKPLKLPWLRTLYKLLQKAGKLFVPIWTILDDSYD